MNTTKTVTLMIFPTAILFIFFFLNRQMFCMSVYVYILKKKKKK